jgi:hypothetical protein
MTGGATGAPTGTGVATKGGVDGYCVAAAIAASRLRRPRFTPVRIKTRRPRITPSTASASAPINQGTIVDTTSLPSAITKSPSRRVCTTML